ncbi:hypothetical protein D3C85_1841950 [compost metagenome]
MKSYFPMCSGQFSRKLSARALIASACFSAISRDKSAPTAAGAANSASASTSAQAVRAALAKARARSSGF